MIEDIKIRQHGNVIIVVVELQEVEVDNKDAIMAELKTAMTANDTALSQINTSNAALERAMDLVESGEPSEEDEIEVAVDDDIIQLVNDNPPNSRFILSDEFSQDIGEWHITKPCYIEGGALIGSVVCDAPDIQFQDVTFNGVNGTILQLNTRTVVNNCELNGHPTFGQQRGISANDSLDCVIEDTQILNIFKDQDTQAICAWDNCKNLTIRGCTLEASGENIMFGGADSLSEDRIPSNILIEECHFTKKLEWRDDSRASCKNLFELKSAINVVVRHCTFENSFVDGQIGYALVLTVRNQDGNAPWSTIKNVTIEDCDFKNMAGGIQILGRDDTHPSVRMEGIVIQRTTFTNIDPSVYGSNGKTVSISGGPKDVMFDQCTFDGVYLNSAFYFSQPEHLTEGLIVSQCEMVEGSYGIMGDGASPGVGSIEMYAPGYRWDENKVHRSGETNVNWPAGTTFV